MDEVTQDNTQGTAATTTEATTQAATTEVQAETEAAATAATDPAPDAPAEKDVHPLGLMARIRETIWHWDEDLHAELHEDLLAIEKFFGKA